MPNIDDVFDGGIDPSLISAWRRADTIEILCSSCPDEQSSAQLSLDEARRLGEWLIAMTEIPPSK